MKAAKPLRFARWLLLLLLAPALLYLLCANLFLRFGLPLVFRSTNQVNATLESAWTLWPGVVHVRGARIVFQDYNLQWSLDLEQARLKLSLHELVQRTFHATEVTGSGAAFKMRHRIQPESKSEPWVSTLAPIPEFTAPAVFEARVPDPPLSDADYNLWTVHIENVDVGVREIWAHFVRFQGEGRARGAFRLRPARALWVGPASLALERGAVTLGSDQLARNLSGTVRCVVDPFDVRVPEGREVFRFISTELDLHGQGVTPDPVLRQFFADSGFSLDTTPGTLLLSARIQRGKFTEQSLLELELPATRARFKEFGFDAREAKARLAAGAGGRVESSLRVARAELRSEKASAKSAPAILDSALASVLSSGLDAAGEAAILEKKLDIGRASVPDVRLFNAFTAGKLRFNSGKVEFGLSSSERGGTLQAKLQGQVQRLRVGNGRTQVNLDGRFKGAVENGSLETGAGRLSVDAAFASVRLNDFTEGEPRLVLDEQERMTLTTRVEREASGRTRTQFQLSSTNAILARIEQNQRHELARLKSLELSGTLSRTAHGVIDAQLKGTTEEARALLGATWFRARARLALELRRFDTKRSSGEARSDLTLEQASAVTEGASDCPWATIPSARVRSRVLLAGTSASATVRAALDSAHLVWGDFRASGRVDLDAKIAATDLDRGRGQLDLALRAQQVTLKSGSRADQGWQAEIPNLVVSSKLKSDEKVSGTLALSAAKNQTRIGGTRMQTDFDARTVLSAIDFDRREARFSGKFSISNARLASKNQRIEGWWANVHADSALLIARENVDLSLPFRAELRDGEPGMAILVEKGSLPALIADAVPVDSVAVIGAVQRRCRLTNIRFTEAKGGPLVGRGLLNSTSDRVQGAFLLRLDALRAISAGIALDSRESAESGVSMLAGDDWLRERTQVLDDNARRILEAPCTTPPAECSDADAE
ncbi:MAG TPA: hypothetical protein VG937_07275 [Polyangiaceae bacterium]|nr:hypothetical protein [Polyangiaceae bacterium]